MLNFFFFYISFYISLYISLDRSLCRSQIKWRTISSSFLTWLRIRCKTFFSFKTFFLNFFFFFTHSWCWHRRCGRRGLYASPLRRFWWPRLTCCPPSHVRCGSSTPGCHGLHCTRLCRPIKSHGGRTITFSHDRYSFSFFYFFFFFFARPLCSSNVLKKVQKLTWKYFLRRTHSFFSSFFLSFFLLFFLLHTTGSGDGDDGNGGGGGGNESAEQVATKEEEELAKASEDLCKEKIFSLFWTILFLVLIDLLTLVSVF